jgi:hypothetical protein
MKLKFVVSTLALAIPLGMWWQINTLSTPDIEVISYHNLGTVEKGNMALVNLPVRNLGNAPLKVEGISTSCGCTTAKLSSMIIPPGSQANLQVEYDSTAHESDRGLLERYIFIASNDPKERDLRIKLSIFVEENPSASLSSKDSG